MSRRKPAVTEPTKSPERTTDTAEVPLSSPAGEAADARPDAASPEAGARFTTRQEFDKRIEALLAQNKALLAGRVYAISLARVEERFGDRWPNVAERAHAITRRAIERHLGDDNLSCRFHDLNYLVVFPRLPAEEAHLRATLIAREISKRSGNGIAVADLVVRKAVTHLGGNLVFRDIDSAEPRPHPPGSEPGPLDRALPRDAPAPADAIPDRLQFLYQPLWNVRSRVLSTYLCLPARPLASGRIVVGYDTLLGGIDSSGAAELDLAVLARMQHDLAKLLEEGRTLLLSCPVHVDTLSRPNDRRHHLDLCRRLPEAARQFVVFEIVCDSEGVSEKRLQEVVPLLNGLCRAAILRLPGLDAKLPQLSGLGLHAVGADLGGGGLESRVFEELEHFAAAAEYWGARSFVHGLGSLSLTTAAVCAGFDYVDGEAITSVIDAPQGVHRFDIQDMFARLLPPA